MNYKNISTTGNLEDLVAAVAVAMGITLTEAEVLTTPYIQGQIDREDLLANIAGQLAAIPGLITNIDTAIAAVPNLGIPAGAKTVFTLLLQNQRRILQILQRELKVWRFTITNIKID